MKYKEDKKSFYNTMSREKFIFFRLSLIFILMFSSIINLDFPYDKDCKETFPRLAESYFLTNFLLQVISIMEIMMIFLLLNMIVRGIKYGIKLGGEMETIMGMVLPKIL